MKQQINNLKDAHIGLLASKVNKNISSMKSIEQVIKDLEKFHREHRFIKLPAREKKPSWDATEMEITQKISEVFGCTIKEIFGNSRKTRIVQARHLTSYILFNDMKMTSNAVADFVGHEKHSSVLWAVKACKLLQEKNSVFIAKREIVYTYLRTYKKIK